MRTREAAPSLKKAAIILVVTLVAFVGAGVALYSWDSEPAEKVVAAKDRAKIEPVGTPRARGEVVKTSREDTPVAGVSATDSAFEVVDDAVEAPPASEPARYADAERAYLEKDYARSAELFAQFTKENPGHLWGRYMNGLALRRLGQLDEAEAELAAALEISPGHGKSLVNLGRVLIDANRPADALNHLEHAVEGEPDNVDAQRVRARALHSLGRAEEALAGYATALAIDENDAWSLNNMGLILIEQERFEEAQVPLVKACAADEGNATCRNNLGVALERAGDATAARNAYGEALALDPEYEKARISLARVEAQSAPAEAPEAIVAAAGEPAIPPTETPETP
jgi:Tfp pilus assembly protein PilF